MQLKDVPAGFAGRALGMRSGDTVVAVNGRGFRGDLAALQTVLSGSGGEMALTVQRGGSEVTVLTDTLHLGRWEAVPALADDASRRRIDPAFLRNWEVMRAVDGSYDLFPHRLPATAMLLPQLWLMQMRLWLPCAMLVAAVTAGMIVHPALALVVHAAAGVHLRSMHAMYLRLDRRARGLSFQTVLAVRTEAQAHAAYRALQPEDQYIFAPAAKRHEAVNA
ncbi:hypothetical protein HYN69_15200 [Gemmobacter aquarius]|uniref:PDZ domain-containing protein n=1 Tax=Paragemmobacter aquarius TaxID=2169400 RepID=A0A2S0UPE8_9RHOB|nr:hypothetical protein HYN69_15200 [Gemmobacter aquarius]